MGTAGGAPSDELSLVQEREATSHRESFVTLAKGKFMPCFCQKGRGSVLLPLALNSNPYTQLAYFGVIL